MASNLTKYPGRDFVLKVRMPSGNFETLGGCRSNSQSNANETIDVSNKSDGVWRQMIPGGQKAMSLSAGGVVTNDAVFAYATTELRNDRGLEVMTCYGDGRIEYATVLGTSSEITGEHNASQDFSLSLESADTVTELAIDVLPDYRLDFAGEQSLAPVFGEGDVTFLRASSGTYLGFDGLIKTAAIDTPRFEHAASGACLGLLVEEQRTNLLLGTTTLDAVSWVRAGVTATAGQLAPDGTLSAVLVESVTPGGRLQHTYVLGATGTYSYSFYGKLAGPSTVQRVLLRDDTAAQNYSVDFNADGSVLSSGNATGYAVPVGNGFFRYHITTANALPSGNTVIAYIYPGNANDVGEQTIAWGGQLEQGASATSYIPTTTAQVTRAKDRAFVLPDVLPTLTAGALHAEAVLPLSGVRRLAVLNDNTDDDANVVQLLYIDSTEEYSASVISGGVSQSDIRFAAPATVSPTPVKMATSFAANDFAATVNGSAAVVDASGVIPAALSSLEIGALKSGDNIHQANGAIGQISIYAQALTPADLQALTE